MSFDEEEEAVASEGDNDGEHNDNDLKLEARECIKALAEVRAFCQQQEFKESVHVSLKTIKISCIMEASDSLVPKSAWPTSVS